jgi:hypothetical protein
MATKRKSTGEFDSSPGSSKKMRADGNTASNILYLSDGTEQPFKPNNHPKNKQNRRQKPMVDYTYGQYGAIPGLDDDFEEEYDDDNEDDGTRAALQYLRAVR